MGHLPEYLSRAGIVLDCVLVTFFSVVLGTWYKAGRPRSFFLQASQNLESREVRDPGWKDTRREVEAENRADKGV